MCDLAQESSELGWEAEAGRLGHTDLSLLHHVDTGTSRGELWGAEGF